MSWLGLDIGGANLKAANATGWTRSVPFPLWRNPDGLAQAVKTLVDDAPACQGLAVTMTGELCDCFRSKEEGVRHILSAITSIAAGKEVFTYLVDGRFVSTATACALPQLAAASNWRALAEFIGRYHLRGSGLLVDIGSTTSDVITILNGRVSATGLSDPKRLVAGELIYTGVGRTPLCAVVDELPWRDSVCPVAAELFATTADAYLLLGRIDADPMASWTADGRPLDIINSRQRIARQICADSSELTNDDLLAMAHAVYAAQLGKLATGIDRVVGRLAELPTMVLVSGAGEFLARDAVANILPKSAILPLSDQIGYGPSRCAPAYAVAVLAEEIANLTRFQW